MNKEEIEQKLKVWSKKSNMDYSEILTIFKESTEIVKKLYPNVNKDALIKKILLRTKTQIKSRLLGFSREEQYSFICLGFSDIRDNYARLREEQLQKYRDYIVKGNEMKAFEEKIVSKKGDKIIPLFPKLTRGGVPSKLYGQPIPSPPESFVRNAFGFGWRDSEKGNVKGIFIELRGEIANTNLQINKSYSIFATCTSDNGKLLQLQTSKSIPKPIDDLQLKYTPNEIKEKFSDYYIDLSSILDMEEIPLKYRIFAILEGIASFPFGITPSMKGNISIMLDSESDDFDSVMARCLIPNKFENMLNFPELTKVLVAGSLWIAEDEEGNKTPIVNCYGIFPYETIPNNNIHEITEELFEDESIDNKSKEEIEDKSKEEIEEEEEDIW